MATLATTRSQLKRYALSLPGAWEDHPWGEDVVKVGKKVFVFLGAPSDEVGVGVKLGRSWGYAMSRPLVKEAGYGLGRSGWVEARFGKGDDVPIDLLKEWILESYETVAPKKKVATTGAASSTERAAPKKRSSVAGRPGGSRLR